MNTKYCFEELDINGVSVAEAIAALQAWEAENPEATESCLNIYSDGYEGAGVEITFHRPMTEVELSVMEIQQANAIAYQEERDRNEYERLKAKYEGN
jgi:hypothetical protein